MTRLGALVLVIVAAVIAWVTGFGCNSDRIVPEPGEITLQDAMRSVGEGLVAMKAAQESLRTGLVPSEVVVTFNISANATDEEKLYVEVGAPTSTGVTGKGGGEATSEMTTGRGNQITITFKNLLYASTGTIAYDKSPDDIAALFGQVNTLIELYMKTPRPWEPPPWELPGTIPNPGPFDPSMLTDPPTE